jgi:dinuclear metal center YbgI/SA1388 family protein
MSNNPAVNLSLLVSDLNELLSINNIEDYKLAFNGLQVENTKNIEKISVAVDACEAVLQRAIAADSDLLIVHHGLFWNGSAPVCGPYYRKLKLALENDLAVYSVHLPLDAHPRYGNNALFANEIGLSEARRPFLGFGWQCEVEISRSELVARTERAVQGRVHCSPGGPEVVRRVGIVTGGAGGEIFKAAEAGVDTFITGEGPHWSYTAAEELGVNLLYAGHYATETFGVKALGRFLQEKFGLHWEFIDHPTGL